MSGSVRTGHTLAVVMAAPSRQPVRLLDAETLEPLPVQPGGPEGGAGRLLTSPTAVTDDAWRPPCGASRARGRHHQDDHDVGFVWDPEEPRDRRLGSGCRTATRASR